MLNQNIIRMSKTKDESVFFSPALDVLIAQPISESDLVTPKENSLPDYIEFGVCDCAKLSSSYKKLVEYTLKEEMTKEELMTEFAEAFKISEFANIFQTSGFSLSRRAQSSIQTLSQAELELVSAVKEIDIIKISKADFCKIAYDYFCTKYTAEKVLLINCISYNDLKLVCKLFCKIRKIIAKINKQSSRNRMPNYVEEIKFIKEYMEKHFGERITLSNIQNEIKAQIGELKTISKTTISKLLRNKLHYSYKKCINLNENSKLETNMKRYLEAVRIQLNLCQSNIETKIQSYAWGIKGGCSYLRKFNEDFICTACIAFSSKAFYLIMIKTGTFKGCDFHEFLKTYCYVRLKMGCSEVNDFILLMDNASTHKTKEIKNFLANQKISAVTIPPYEPTLNPAEQANLWIKRRYRMNIALKRPHSIRLLNQCASSINRQMLEKIIKISHKQVIEKVLHNYF